MNEKELRNILQAINEKPRGGAPRAAWVKKNREILLMQVRNTIDSAAPSTWVDRSHHLFAIFVPWRPILVVARGFAVFVLAATAVLGGGFASAQLYREATPGSMAYGLKRDVEQLQIAFAPTTEYRTRLHTEFADRRIDEVAQLAEGPVDRLAYLPEVLVAFDDEVSALHAGLETMRVANPQNVAETAKFLERRMASYQTTLRKAHATLPVESRLAVAASRDRVDEVSIAAMTVIVEKHLAGDMEAPRAVVIMKMEERLLLAEEKLDSAPPEPALAASATPSKAAKAKAAIAEAKAFLKEEKYEAALSKVIEVAELTKEQPAEEPAPATEEPVKEGEEAEGSAPVEEKPATTDPTTKTPADSPAPVEGSGE